MSDVVGEVVVSGSGGASGTIVSISDSTSVQWNAMRSFK